jgi:hypothetical protein
LSCRWDSKLPSALSSGSCQNEPAAWTGTKEEIQLHSDNVFNDFVNISLCCLESQVNCIQVFAAQCRYGNKLQKKHKGKKLFTSLIVDQLASNDSALEAINQGKGLCFGSINKTSFADVDWVKIAQRL